jgi:lipopolysaccharide export system permease protein
MGIVDRYVLRTFLKVFAVCLVSISGIYMVGDFVGNFTEFVDHASSQDNLWIVLSAYYGARLPWFFDMSSRIIALISAVFVITWLYRHNELTALMAAGVSRRRVVVPLIVATGVITGLAVINREVGIPAVRYQLCRRSRDWVGDGGRHVRPMFDNRTGIWISGKNTYAADRRITSPTFRLPPGLEQMGGRIVARQAHYRDATAQHPSGYLLKQVTEPKNLVDLASIDLAERRIIFSPHDTDWLQPDQCFVASDVSFEHLESGLSWYQFSSTTELLRGLRNRSLGFASDVRILVHYRFIQPFLDMTLLFLGLPIVLSRESRNVFVAIGLCILMVAGFSAVVLGCQTLGMYDLVSPALAAWSPLMLFVPAAVAMSGPLKG